MFCFTLFREPFAPTCSVSFSRLSTCFFYLHWGIWMSNTPNVFFPESLNFLYLQDVLDHSFLENRWKSYVRFWKKKKTCNCSEEMIPIILPYKNETIYVSLIKNGLYKWTTCQIQIGRVLFYRACLNGYILFCVLYSTWILILHSNSYTVN